MTDIEDDFKRAILPQEKPSRFEVKNGKLLPYIKKWMKAREADPDSVANTSDFYDNFLKPHGITITKDRFYVVVRSLGKD
jgi:hypothetical protein